MENLYTIIRDNHVKPGTEFYSTVHGRLLFLKLTTKVFNILCIDTHGVSIEEYLKTTYSLSDDEVQKKINELDSSSDNVYTFDCSGHWIYYNPECGLNIDTPDQILKPAEAVYKYCYNTGEGKISGIFVANVMDIKDCEDNNYTVDFGDILGSHSGDICSIEFNDLRVEPVLTDLEDVLWFKTKNLSSGYNPLDSIEIE